MTLYYKSDKLVAKIKVDKGANPKQIDTVMARDGLVRCTRKEYLIVRAAICQNV